jgi:hypothetical protein
MHRLVQTLMVACFLIAGWCQTGPVESQAQALNPNPPPTTVRLVFIHHSMGEGLLNAGLFAQLNANNYYVTDTYYGWGPDDLGAPIGDHTDIGQWYNWFLDPASATFLTALLWWPGGKDITTGCYRAGCSTRSGRLTIMPSIPTATPAIPPRPGI